MELLGRLNCIRTCFAKNKLIVGGEQLGVPLLSEDLSVMFLRVSPVLRVVLLDQLRELALV